MSNKENEEENKELSKEEGTLKKIGEFKDKNIQLRLLELHKLDLERDKVCDDKYDKANREKLQNELQGKERTAYFVCCIVLCNINGKYETFEGRTYGEITTDERGSTEFGYDCIFFSDDLKKTFGEASEEEKNGVSHRGRAIKKMLEIL